MKLAHKGRLLSAHLCSIRSISATLCVDANERQRQSWLRRSHRSRCRPSNASTRSSASNARSTDFQLRAASREYWRGAERANLLKIEDSRRARGALLFVDVLCEDVGASRRSRLTAV